MKIVNHDETFDSWRNISRSLLEEKIHFDDVIWQASNGGSLFDCADVSIGKQPSALKIPREFMEDAKFVSSFRDESTWGLLYKLAFRIVYEEKHLMSLALDNDVLDFHRRMKLVSRDLHKMKAFVRFKEIKKNDQSIYVAWHRPDHRVLKLSAPFFTDRFNGMNWAIFTEEESMSWINNKLEYGPGITQQEAQSFDSTEELWKTYYASIFNPGRVKVKMMKSELPVRHWKTLPEAELIDGLIKDAPNRLDAFYKSQRPSALQWVPNEASLPELKAALPNCSACDICSKATAPVNGSGPNDAEIVFVGEQPGLDEDLAGSPFVGPAGKLFMDALAIAGINRSEVYLTNAVKAFKWKESNGMRKHVNPSSSDIAACRPWLKTELEIVKPKILVCLGASAAQSVFGKMMKIADSHGKVFQTSFCDQTIILSHPSAILRQPDPEDQKRLHTQFVGDILALKNLSAQFVQ